ncbi:unnamed protein product, partial [Polarella glacialis]
ALAAKSRTTCAPLLEQLRLALQASIEAPGCEEALTAADRVELLGAAGELHPAIGVTTATLRRLLESCQKSLESGSEVQLSPGRLSLVARACGRLTLDLPEESMQLFQALLNHLHGAEARSQEAGPAVSQVLRACRQLPAQLRRQLVDKLLKVDGRFDGLGANELEVRLLLVHDLPLQAAASGDEAGCRVLGSLTRELVQKLLDTIEAQGRHEASCSALANSFLAASTAAHGLSTLSTAEDEATLLEALAVRALDMLDGRWSQLVPLEVHTLFRVPGDPSKVAARAAKHVSSMQDPAALAALLQAALALPATADRLDFATRAALRKLVASIKDSRQLSSMEAALRKGPSPVNDQQRSLLSGIRDQIFGAILKEEPVWNRRPARGYVRYVEQCLERGRRPPRVVAAEEAAPESSVNPLEMPSIVVTTSQAKDIDLPKSGISGVQWHAGMEGWEVKLDVRGRKVLGGYFKPRGYSDEAKEEAREEALRCWEGLHRQHLVRPHSLHT